jgi:hypothetical protein
MQRGIRATTSGRCPTIRRPLYESGVRTKLDTIEILQGMAGAAGASGEDLRAARLWGAAEALLEATGLRLGPAERGLHERHLIITRSRLGAATWEEALAEGRAMTLEEGLAYALEDAGA